VRRNTLITLVLMLATVATSGCSNGGPEPGPPATTPDAGVEGSGAHGATPALLPSQPSPTAGSAVRTVLVPRFQVEVRSRLAGLVRTLLVEEGDRVAEGQVLAALEDEEVQLNRDRAAADAQRTRALYLRNLQGFQEGGPIRVVSELEVEVSRAEYRKAQADSALRELELDYARIRSPISGRVVERHISRGDWVGYQDHLFTVADLGTLRAVFIVPYALHSQLSPGSKIILTVDPDREAIEVDGLVILKSPIVDPASMGVKITIEIPNADLRLRPGLPVSLKPVR
jgi:membrane fusion protein (multidrug efflux system)